MALTPSNMIPLGTQAPDFSLLDVITQKQVQLKNLDVTTALVVMFICNHCPYVKHIQKELVDVVKKYQKKGIQFIAINSNDVEQYPEDSPEKMKDLAKQLGYTFPYLYDQTQAVAQAYDAACTPDFYIFDRTLSCVYRGQFDGARPGNSTLVTGADLTAALDAILSGNSVSADQKPSMGCNIKWKRK